MEAKSEVINIKVSKKEKNEIETAAEKENVSVSAYVRSKACTCGETGYEGIFRSVQWTCQKCGKLNIWKKK
jgi:hypothetical protein